MNYLRQAPNFHKSQPNHHSPHRHHHQQQPPPLPPNSTSRAHIPPMSNSQISPHSSAYLLHAPHHPSTENPSSRPQTQPSHYSSQSKISAYHHDALKNSQEAPISIQAFIKKNVNDFVGSSSRSS